MNNTHRVESHSPKQIPEGYKQSPLGIIPQEWEVKRLGEIYIEARLGGNYENAESNTGIPVIKMGNIGRGKIILDKVQYLPSNEQYNNDDILRYGDLLFNTRNTLELVGKVAMWRDELPYAIYNSNLLRIKFNKQFVYSNEYMNTAFNSNLSIKQLRGYATGTTSVAAIYSRDLFKMRFALPPLLEQEKIAEVLSVWDEAIERQAKLTALLEKRKQALMQRLLKPKEHWKEVNLGDVFTHIKETNDGKVHVVMTISGKLGLISQENKFDRVIAGDSLKKYTLLKKGDFAYNKGNSKTYPMGCIYKLDISETALVPFVYICFRKKKNVDLEFYKFFFVNHGLDRQLNQIITSGARGDGLLNVNKEDFFDLKVPLPPLSEQTAIAEVLSTADSEIALASKKLESLRTQKKGLMQQLLTGKIRVKI